MDDSQWLADGAACLAAALEYRDRGWCPIPLCPSNHVGVGKGHAQNCKGSSWGKAPLVAGWTTFEELPTARDLEGWWKLWPNANVGIVMGTISGLVGIDVDGPGGEAGLANLDLGEWPPALEFSTPAGGRRLLFEIPPELVLKIAFDPIGPKEELRFLGEGSQTVAPPSRHRNGKKYEWVKYGA